MGWTRRASSYIRDNIESKYKVIGWESEVAKRPYLGSRLLGVMLSVNGVFLGTQLITLILGLLKTTFTLIDIVLITCDVICVFATFVALRSRTLEYKKN